ncbi:MAG: hypothetical protein KAJ19_08145, partial [Gammaproteobacteria bacterium]|nr:hypothetical protein [Gammaproteobacteria bacterium]
MNTKQNPFSLYDFLGYFTPGAIVLYGILLILGHIDVNSTSIGYVNKYLSFDKAEIYVPFILFAYIVGHFLSFISSVTIEKYSIWAHGYPSNYLLGIVNHGYYHAIKSHNIRVVIRFVIWVLLAPISFSDYIFGKIVGVRDLYTKPLDPLLRNVLRKRIGALIKDHANIQANKEHGKTRNVDFFRYVYHFAVENSPNHLPKMQNYVALYGFLRTITLISLLLFWSIVWHSILSNVAFLDVMLWLLLS